MKWTVVWLCFFSIAGATEAKRADNHVNNICSTWGRQHFKTFDGDVFQFPGLCEYNLVKDCRKSENKFSVHIRREENDGNITISYVVVTISENTFTLTKTEVAENENPVTLPHYSGGVKVEESTFYIRLRATKVGIIVMWNREDAVMVEVSNRYQNQTCGLCGDFNGVPVYDEFMDNVCAQTFYIFQDGVSPNFTIRAHLDQCAQKRADICLKALKIHLGTDNVLMFTSEGKVQQNMEDISLPYYSGDIRIFHASSFHILLNAKFGLQIQIQRVPVMQVYISLESSYKEKTSGLCGNYNMALNDDMTSPQGSQEGTAVTFGNSWKADHTCPDAGRILSDPCSISMEIENYARHWCEMLRNPNGTFANCHSEVNPEYYYKRCLYSTCSCEKSEDCLCAVFTSYGRACAAKGKFVTDFGDQCEKHTKSCPSTQIFTYNHRRCQLTCSSLSTDQRSCTSHFLPVVGCFCPDGLYLNEKDTCVPKEECSCSHNEDYIEAGKSVNFKSEHW
ncbi:mucin-2-like [Poecilia latipinna]|uniref:mucin-2-like n=1 Tax=Poecilia latipinna TaxID=48699 RepID=UPI00072EB171|nr:PREDICTED: mucin-2-like [Poecilia latipinna]